MIEARDEKGTKKHQLSQKFQALIDQAAMERKLAGTDGYLDQWNKTKAESRPGSASDVVAEVAAEIEARFMQIRAEALKKPSV